MDKLNSHYQSYMYGIACRMLDRTTYEQQKAFFLLSSDTETKSFWVDCVEVYCRVKGLDFQEYLIVNFPFIKFSTRSVSMSDPLFGKKRKFTVRIFAPVSPPRTLVSSALERSVDLRRSASPAPFDLSSVLSPVLAQSTILAEVCLLNRHQELPALSLSPLDFDIPAPEVLAREPGLLSAPLDFHPEPC